MARAKKQKQRERVHREPIVRDVAELLKTGTPTWWRYTSEVRHALRAAMCLKGMAWVAADERAELIVRLARHRIGLSLYPTWSVSSTSGHDLLYRFCRGCGGHLEEESRYGWCSTVCRAFVHNRSYVEADRRADVARRVAMGAIFGATPAPVLRESKRRCLHCEGEFTPQKADNRFCSRHCSIHHDRQLPLRDCETCGKRFRPRFKISRHCSRLCASRVRKVEKACAWCDKPFTTARGYQLTCSPAHGAAHRLREKRAATAAAPDYKLTCGGCGETFSSRRSDTRACSPECRADVIRQEKAEIARRLRARKRAAAEMALAA